MALQIETKTYERELPRLLLHDEGKFALIQGEKVIDDFDSYQDALKVGYPLFGHSPFMVKNIESKGRIHVITRLIVPCPV